MAIESRQRILEFLKRNGESSAGELSRAIGLTSVTIRHHLAIMRMLGLVAEPAPRHKPRPGRPEMVYRLTAEADPFLPRAYALITINLMAEMHRTFPEDRLKHILAQSGSFLAEEILGEEEIERPLRLRKARAFLETNGYYPTIDTQAEGTSISLSNCPFLEASRQKPLLCTFDLALLQTLLDAQVTFKERIAIGHPQCTLIATFPSGH